MGMDLRQFVKQALMDVAFGVHEARVDCQEIVAIVPANLNGDSQNIITEIEFDIAVAVSAEKASKKAADGKAEVKINVVAADFKLGGGGGGETGEKSMDQTTSRIAFKVPIVMTADFTNNPDREEDRKRVKRLVEERFPDSI